MADDSVDPRLVEQVKKLQEKFSAIGQDLSSYLEGILHSDYLTYWDYLHLDTLLSLQTPKTSLPDEKMFIMYHQITELYFKMVLWELEQIAFRPNIDEDFFIERLDRVIRYFTHLTQSFDIMVEGLDKDQFGKFRMALLPSSGFQSAQYRLIEMASTDLLCLIPEEDRKHVSQQEGVNDFIEKLYWRRGATELATGKKTLTLQQFEAKYLESFMEAAHLYQKRNLRALYLSKFVKAPKKAKIVERLRTFDALVNMDWRLAHLKSAAKHLTKDLSEIKATGGTNWQKYLPPRFQRIMFFPEVWSEEEQAEWGKAAVMRALAQA